MMYHGISLLNLSLIVIVLIEIDNPSVRKTRDEIYYEPGL